MVCNGVSIAAPRTLFARLHGLSHDLSPIHLAGQRVHLGSDAAKDDLTNKSFSFSDGSMQGVAGRFKQGCQFCLDEGV